MAFTHDGRSLLLTGHMDSGIVGVRLMDLRTGAVKAEHVFPRHESITLSPDGVHYLASTHEEGTWLYRLPGRRLRRIVADTERQAVCFSSDGTHLLVAERVQGIARLTETRTGKVVRFLRLAGLIRANDRLLLTPGNRLILGFEYLFLSISRGEGTVMWCWDGQTGKRLTNMAGHLRAPLGVDFSRDGRTLEVFANQDGLYRWDTTGRLLSRKELRDEEEELALEKSFRPVQEKRAGKFRIALREGIRFDDLEDPKKVIEHGRGSMSADGRLLVWSDSFRELCLWEIDSGGIVYRFSATGAWGFFAPIGWKFATAMPSDLTVLLWDVRSLLSSEPARRGCDLSALWTDLASRDARCGQKAAWLLAGMPGAEVFLARRLRPVLPVAGQRLAPLLAELGSANFARRTAAERALASFHDAARLRLRQLHRPGNDLELRLRAGRLLGRLRPDAPERLREMRAVMALEVMGTPAARALLRRLAAGLPEAHLTREAQAALGRLPGLESEKGPPAAAVTGATRR
jgi:hypothetical protein